MGWCRQARRVAIHSILDGPRTTPSRAATVRPADLRVLSARERFGVNDVFDVLMLILGLGSFVLLGAYALGCDRL